MGTESGAWLADLLARHEDSLVAQTSAAALRQSPVYSTLSEAEREAGFRNFYRALARTFAQNAIDPVRTYLQAIAADRLRRGATAGDLIQIMGVAREAMRALIEQETGDNPAQRREATRQMETVQNTVNMILSEVNLRLVAHPPPDPAF